MAATGNFLPPVNVQQTHSAASIKHDLLSAHGLFPGESFPAQASYIAKSLEVNCTKNPRIEQLSLSKRDNLRLSELHFGRLQPTDREYCGRQIRNFCHFVTREAILDEEYWAAAWLRAEAHSESVSCMRHVDNYKKKYAKEEFYALKRRCLGQDGNSLKCFCFVAVKKEDKCVRRSVLNSIVGTLDLSFRQFVQGETYPGEIKRRSAVLASQEPLDAHKYAYIANVCVAKFARRQGIAANMLYLARDVTKIAGLKKLFVHVHADNNAAQDLYEKIGFKVVEAASSPASTDKRILILMCMSL